MEKVKIKCLVDVYDFKKGVIIEVDENLARQCVITQKWELVTEPIKKVVKTK